MSHGSGAGGAEPVIFLDLDGVLNGHDFDDSEDVLSSTILPRCVEHLNRVLRETGASLVISSAWRYMVGPGAMTVLGFEYLLRTHGVAAKGRVLGVTCRDEEVGERGQQIRDWLNERGGDRRYVVLDDGGDKDGEWYDLGINAAGHPVVWTKGNEGMTDWDAERAIRILKGNP